MKFEEWVNEASKDFWRAIKSNVCKSDLWTDASGHDTRKNQMLPYYLQYRMWSANRSLVWATWGLAIATIILVIISLFMR